MREAQKSRESHADEAMRLSRRALLQQCGGGMGAIALCQMLHSHSLATESSEGLHHPAKARRVLQLFMNGGVSQMDTFDYKPELERRHGQRVDFGLKTAVTSVPGAIMKSPFQFRQHGQSGRWVSDLLPGMARHVDRLAFCMAMTSRTNVHGPASYLQNTGFMNPGFPAMGAWISYGLGRLSDELPTFVVLPDHRGLPYNNAGNFSSAFLPATHAGTLMDPNAADPMTHLAPPENASEITVESEREGRQLLRQLHQASSMAVGQQGDTRLEARLVSFELAAKMQLAAPKVLDLSQETAATQKAYGLEHEHTRHFGRSCLVARRLLEHGVRFVQVWSGMGGPRNNWDNHNDIPSELPAIARTVDQPIDALLTDLYDRGMMDDTLVIWTSEFGRMPFTQGATGRDHNGGTFVTWLAGAGVRGGMAHGASDEFSYRAAEGATPCYDLHATILHLLGIDHLQLTAKHNGIDRRLTDVHGHVITELLA